jgi:hypothetical protein
VFAHFGQLLGYVLGYVFTNSSGADFSYIFFHGKSLSAEFLGKMIFQNFFPRKIPFFPTFLGENFPRNFPPNFPRKKMYEKIGHWSPCLLRSDIYSMGALELLATKVN